MDLLDKINFNGSPVDNLGLTIHFRLGIPLNILFLLLVVYDMVESAIKLQLMYNSPVRVSRRETTRDGLQLPVPA